MKFDNYTASKVSLAAKALADELKRSGAPVVTSYGLFIALRKLYRSGRKLWLRESVPDHAGLSRVREQLMEAKVLAPDKDFKQGVYRVIEVSDRSAEEICGIVEPHAYISHLSAMARYGLTDRRVAALQLTAPSPKTANELWEQIFEKDYGADELAELTEEQIIKPTPRRDFPQKVRGQSIDLMRRARIGQNQKVRGSFARIASIGQVFADMVEDPETCGGMRHVLEVWQENAAVHLTEVIEAIERSQKRIAKVRAGYILNELMGLQNPEVLEWTRFAQRGGSSVLDPTKPFASKFSERWMLSLNVS